MLTFQDALATILAATGVALLTDTVDTVKTGDPTRPLTSLVTTFLATAEVIARASSPQREKCTRAPSPSSGRASPAV
jgi:hypothetical protein